MDDRSGEIYTEEQLKKRAEMFKDLLGRENEMKHFVPMKFGPTQKQMERIPPKVGRNEPCPCGSGKKFKKCHLVRDGEPTAVPVV
jgi:uncharacterized protein YecA (UPF0149 family)